MVAAKRRISPHYVAADIYNDSSNVNVATMDESMTTPLLEQTKQASEETGSPSSPPSSPSASTVMPEMDFAGGFLRILGGATNNELEETVGKLLRQGSIVALLVWMSLLTASFLIAPPESFERLEGAERNANMAVFCILLYVNASRLLRMAVRDKSFVFVNSGIMTGSLTVQFIAVVSIALMIFFPTPVIVDPVTGIRSHLVRWSEWIPLCFLMTFLTESVDMPISSNNGSFNNGKSIQKPIAVAWAHGITLGISTSAGMISAFCTTWNAWLVVIGISWVLFSSLYVRLYQRYSRLLLMTPGTTVNEKEAYDRAKYGLKTIAVCAVAWTGLAASWFLIALMAPRSAPDSIFSNESLILTTESFFEALSKIWYADLLIELHNVAFDDASRTMRRLEEIRSLMSAVWDHSSDILVWGTRENVISGSHINGIVSPSFFGNKAQSLTASGDSVSGLSTLLIEVKPGTREYRSYKINLTEPITREKALALKRASSSNETKQIDLLQTDQSTRNVSIIADLLCEAYQSQATEKTLMKELFFPQATSRLQVSSALGEQPIYVRHCEARINQLDNSSRLIVLRDISERFQKFQLEKKLVVEKTARQKDSEANRFTRHEVKNGILAAIGLVESIRDAKKTSSTSSVLSASSASECRVSPTEAHYNHERQGDENDEALWAVEDDQNISRTSLRFFELSSGGSGYEDSLGELDNTLRDILDSITDHAMSLDVVNEVYDVRKERVVVPELLSNIRRQANSVGRSRFTLKSFPMQFPVLGLDPRLLRHIYQNALSNACRYGRSGGDIVTNVAYDEEKKEFRLDVVNEPGSRHETLLKLSKEEVERRVFSKGSRLHEGSEDDEEYAVANSSGDGAWIVKKCARILRGDVSLNFEENQTIFSFWCPARKLAKSSLNENDEEALSFQSVPQNTWGIVIDDSGIQRKLMDRFLKIAGIEKERRIILGKTSQEIFGFPEKVIHILKTNPDDRVLLIADENLEVVDGSAVHSTVSGSSCIAKILEELAPAEENRLLALVRSANDSSEELSMYMSRAHGYLLKEPIDKRGVLDTIRPWWFKRFPPSDGRGRPSLSRSNSESSTCGSDGYDPFYDIVATLEVIDALCKVSSIKSLKSRWRSIKEKLQALKGDLKSTISPRKSSEGLVFVISEIDLLRRKREFPTDFHERWTTLRSQLNVVVQANR